MVMYNIIKNTAGHNHRVVCPAEIRNWSIGLPKLITEEGIEVRTVAGRGTNVAMRLINEEVMKFNPDIIVNHWWRSSRIQRLNKFGKTRKIYGGAKTVLVSHNNDPSPPGYDYYVSVSKHNARFQVHAKDRKGAENHRVIYNGIDVEKYKLRKHPLEGRFTIGRVSSLVKFKAPKDWIYFANSFNIPDVLHMIVGEGERRRQFEYDVQQLGVQHKFVLPGELSQSGKAVAKMLAKFDIVCYVTEKTEAFSLAILEAMAAGLPVVAQNAGGMAEQIIHGKTGFLCNSRSEVKQYCELLSRSPQLVSEMGRAARERARQHFGLKKMAQEYEALFSELTNG